MRLLRLRTCLVATDLDVSSDAALDSAARLSAATGAALHVVHVVSQSDDTLVRTGRSVLREQDVRRALDRAGVPSGDPRLHIIPGDARTTIGPLAGALSADVIVMGRRRAASPGKGAAVGGTATAVIRNTVSPCLVVSTPLQLPIDRVLIAVDGSEASRGALVVAVSWASALRSRAGAAPTVTAVHVDAGASARSPAQAIVDRELDALRRDAGDWAGVNVTGVTLDHADPVAAITRYVTELDPGLVVLGTRALGRPTHPALGSVASAVTRDLSTPVLLVPPSVWEAYARDLGA